MDQVTAAGQTVSIALVGSGGAGAITAGQLLLQAAGRAGRADRPGRAILQTWKPDHEALQAPRLIWPDDAVGGAADPRR